MGAENSDSSKASLLLDGRYRLIQKIGSGGRGVVYEARHEEMGQALSRPDVDTSNVYRTGLSMGG